MRIPVFLINFVGHIINGIIRMKRYLFILASIIISLSASGYDKVFFHCDKDTIIINGLLKSPELDEMDNAQRMAFFAKNLTNTESNIRREILEADTTLFTIDVHSFNPLSLISTCIALAQAYETSSAPNWRDFASKYESVMFKGGKAGDFVSRFLYSSDWIADNIFRGNIIDETLQMEGLNIKKKEKSIDYISHHKDSFKAFENPKNLDRIKMLEMGFRNHQIIYVSNGDLTNPARFKRIAKDGDIVFLLCTDFNLDSRDMGIVYHDGDNLRFIHISPAEDKVVVEELPFELYVKRNIKRIQGARVMRISQ